jgi:hypothetical protein
MKKKLNTLKLTIILFIIVMTLINIRLSYRSKSVNSILSLTSLSLKYKQYD